MDVSLWVTKSARARGCCASAASTRTGSTVSPYGASMACTVMPNARAMSCHRSPNLPQRTTSTSSPGEQRLTTAASSAPVPDAARTMTSLRVPISSARPARTRAKSASNSGVRWWMIGRPMAWRTSGGIGVGPGARRWYFFMP